MRTKTINVYTFSELSEKAKDRAKQDHAAAFGYYMAKDAMKSLEALASHFDGKVSNYQIDWFASSYSSAEFEMPDDMTKAEINRRLRALGTYNRKTMKGHGDCKLTGCCTDEDAIDGFRIAFHAGETDLDKLMQSAFETWLDAAQSNCEDQYTNERFAEDADANNMEFYEDGELCNT